MTNAIKKKILFIAEAVTLAHVGRMLALAESLDPGIYEVLVATDSRYANIIGNPSVPLTTIHSISSQQFFAALDSGKPIYSSQILINYAEQDLALIDSFKPDLIVGDFRLSLAASARKAGIPYINVTNAYWSPYAKLKYLVPEIPLTRILGPSIAQKLFNLARPVAFAQHAQPVNAMLRHFGQPRLPRDLRYAYTEGDLTLYADSPLLVTTNRLPSNHRFIGPVYWSAPLPNPPWWNDIPQDKPVIYANLGSSGQGTLLPKLLQALAELPVSIIAATAGRASISNSSSNVFLTEFISADAACQMADIVICNGGSPSCYLALKHSKPSLSLPVNLDQYLNASLFTQAGAGLMQRTGSLDQAQLRCNVERLLVDAAIAKKTRELASSINQSQATQMFALNIAEQC